MPQQTAETSTSQTSMKKTSELPNLTMKITTGDNRTTLEDLQSSGMTTTSTAIIREVFLVAVMTGNSSKNRLNHHPDHHQGKKDHHQEEDHHHQGRKGLLLRHLERGRNDLVPGEGQTDEGDQDHELVPATGDHLLEKMEEEMAHLPLVDMVCRYKSEFYS